MDAEFVVGNVQVGSPPKGEVIGLDGKPVQVNGSGRKRNRTRRIKYFSHDELRTFFAAIKGPNAVRDAAMFKTMYALALRVQEVVNLRLEDVNFAHNTVFVDRVKGSRGGELPLPADLKKPLQTWIKERGEASGWLFTSSQKHEKGLGVRTVWHAFKKHLRASGLELDVGTHALRHSWAMHACASGDAAITDIQFWLGHVDVSNTVVYAHATAQSVTEMQARLQRSRSMVRL